MTKKKAKLLTLMLAALMLVGIFAGCKKEPDSSTESGGSTSSQSTATSEEDNDGGDSKQTEFSVQLNIMFPGDEPAAQAMVNDAISAKMKEDGLGDFTFNYTFVPWDQYWNKLSMVRAAEEDYDIMWQHQNNISSAVANYLVAPLDEALEKYGQDILANTPDYVFSESTFDGQIYSIPRVVPTAQYNFALSIRGDLRKKYDVPEIKTLDDLDAYFAAIKENEPTMVATGGAPISTAFFRAYVPSWHFPIRMEGSLDFPVYIDLEDDSFTVKNFWASEEFEVMCAKADEYKEKGYYYPDNNPGRVSENEFMSGKLASCFGNVMWPTERIDTLVSNIPDGEIETVFLNPDMPKYITTAEDNLLAVFDHSTKIDESVAFINWINSSQENYDLFSFGIEGVNWHKEGEAATIEGVEPENIYQPINWAWTNLKFHRYSPFLDPDYVNVINTWDDDAIASELLGFVVDTEPIKKELTNLSTVYSTYIDPVLAGTISFADKRDEALSEATNAGIDKIIEELQKQVDDFIANK